MTRDVFERSWLCSHMKAWWKFVRTGSTDSRSIVGGQFKKGHLVPVPINISLNKVDSFSLSFFDGFPGTMTLISISTLSKFMISRKGVFVVSSIIILSPCYLKRSFFQYRSPFLNWWWRYFYNSQCANISLKQHLVLCRSATKTGRGEVSLVLFWKSKKIFWLWKPMPWLCSSVA